jgi:hypothetical protein
LFIHFRNATHFDISYANDEGVIALTCFVYNVYLEIDEVTRIIEGDLVIQGAVYHPDYAPILCIIQFQSDNDDSKSQTIQIAPWDMIITPAEDADSRSTFTIMASLRADVIDVGAASVEIFVDERANVPTTETEDFNFSPYGYIRALHYMTRSVLSNGYIDAGETNVEVPQQLNVDDLEENEEFNDGVSRARKSSDQFEDGETTPGQSRSLSQNNINVFVEDANAENDEEVQALVDQGIKLSASDLVIHSVRIATDYDDLMALQSEGYEVCCEQITEEGTLTDQEHVWKFHICALYSSPEDGGVEDILWLKTPKSIGTLPVLKGYTVFHDTDLTEIEDDVSANNTIISCCCGLCSFVRSIRSILQLKRGRIQSFRS